ncbi:MAG: DUF4173 domain-containing protein [Pseudomonadota bacterium]
MASVSAQRGFWDFGVSLIVLIGCADLLFWGRAPGVSLPLMAAAVFVAACLRNEVAPRDAVRPALLLMIGALPAVEYVQPLSVVFLALSLALALAWAVRPALLLGEIPRAGFDRAVAVLQRWRGMVTAPLALIPAARDGGAVTDAAPRDWRAPVRAVFRNWALPVGGTLVFASLLLQANPVLLDFVSPDINAVALIDRAVFWAGLALMITPLLDRGPAPERSLPNMPSAPRLSRFGVNEGSVLRALWTFNALIAVQTVLDLSILVGGAALPEGMSYAEYAHRGAYPLLATALLAGVFALAARPFLEQGKTLKPLLYLWLGQNVVVCVTAFMRLDLYVAVYGLTYLRLYAMIWMALVAAGLGLTAMQVAARRSNGWLLRAATALGLSTLYAASFINFAHVIARHNITLPEPDWEYLCRLGPMTGLKFDAAKPDHTSSLRQPCYSSPAVIESWPEWGFRIHRLARYAAPDTARERAE